MEFSLEGGFIFLSLGFSVINKEGGIWVWWGLGMMIDVGR